MLSISITGEYCRFKIIHYGIHVPALARSCKDTERNTGFRLSYNAFTQLVDPESQQQWLNHKRSGNLILFLIKPSP